MKILKELISLLPPSKISQIRLVGHDLDNNSKLGKLYYAILENKVSSDKEASKFIYGSKSSLTAYIKLKQRLRERLLNTLFFTDVNSPRFIDYGTAVASCYQEYALVKLLLGKFARNSAIWLAEQLFEQTKKYEISDLNYLVSSDLMNHYGLLELNKKKFQNYKEYNVKFRKILNAEQKASEGLSLISFINLDSKKSNEKDLSYLERLLHELDEIYQEVNTDRFLLYYSNLKSSYYFDNKKYKEIISLVDEILLTVANKEFENQTLKYSLLRKKMNSYFNLGEIKMAIEIANKAKAYTRKNTQNWYIASYYECLFLLHLKRYNCVNKILEETFQKKNSRYLSPLLKEYWLTIEAYIELLKLFGEIEDNKSTFRVQKFINDVPVYQKEKQGRKVAVLLVQLMFFLGRKEYGKYIDRLDALQQYRRRHLGEPNTFRANCIIKMMTKVGKLSFHPVRIEAHTKNDLKALSSMTPEFSNSSSDVEIIPYEHLWEMVLEILEKNIKD